MCNPGAGGRILVRPRVGEAWHVHRGDRRSSPVAAARRVAADLKSPAVRGEFGKGGMTSRARLSCLAGVAGQSFSGSDAGREKSRRSDEERDEPENERRQRRPDLVHRDNACCPWG